MSIEKFDMKFEDFFSEIADLRKKINAPLIHAQPIITPKRFLLYNPKNLTGSFHFMNCHAMGWANLSQWLKTSRTDGKFIMSNGELQKLPVCNSCINDWNIKFPDAHITRETFDITNFFLQYGDRQDIWFGQNIPSDDTISFKAGCFLLYRPVNNMHFHFMKCSQVLHDEQNGWIRAYRFTDDISGRFKLFDGLIKQLSPCEDCLKEFNGGRGWQDYSSAAENEKMEIKNKFSIIEFFDTCVKKDYTAPELKELYKLMENNIVYLGVDIGNKYPENWSNITTMYREAQNYRCEQCGVDLSQHTKLCITHHKNGSHPDIGPDNMQVLCKWCHSRQEYHQNTVNFHAGDFDILEQLWREQGIRPFPGINI